MSAPWEVLVPGLPGEVHDTYAEALLAYRRLRKQDRRKSSAPGERIPTPAIQSEREVIVRPINRYPNPEGNPKPRKRLAGAEV